MKPGRAKRKAKERAARQARKSPALRKAEEHAAEMASLLELEHEATVRAEDGWKAERKKQEDRDHKRLHDLEELNRCLRANGTKVAMVPVELLEFFVRRSLDHTINIKVVPRMADLKPPDPERLEADGEEGRT